MNRYNFLLLLCVPPTLMAAKTKKQINTPPNIILILCDDMGYSDIEPFGAKDIKTPNLNQLSHDGLTLTNFYAGASVSSPSRAALLTGCYPNRIGIPDVLMPHGINWSGELWRAGLHPNETTIPEILKTKGYTTAIFGKWHLGHLPQNMPAKHGFDEFWGIPYSNDMIPEKDPNYPPLTIIHNEKIENQSFDQSQFTRSLTEKTLQFIDKHASQPFFIYLPNPMPHVPISRSDTFKDSSKKGTYGDVIQEIDWSVGKILEKLSNKGLTDNTIIIFTSDNGPWLCYGEHAGSALPLREGKRTSMDGGSKVPFIISWPSQIKPNRRSNELMSAMDILPTITKWVHAKKPLLSIDGICQSNFIEGKTEKSNRKNLLFYQSNTVEAIRDGSWKLHIPHNFNKASENIATNGNRTDYIRTKIGLELFDLSIDPGETKDLSAKYPIIVKKLKAKIQKLDKRLKLDSREAEIYTGQAPPVGKLW